MLYFYSLTYICLTCNYAIRSVSTSPCEEGIDFRVFIPIPHIYVVEMIFKDYINRGFNLIHHFYGITFNTKKVLTYLVKRYITNSSGHREKNYNVLSVLCRKRNQRLKYL